MLETDQSDNIEVHLIFEGTFDPASRPCDVLDTTDFYAIGNNTFDLI